MILIIINVIFGFIILSLLYANINIKKHIAVDNQNNTPDTEISTSDNSSSFEQSLVVNSDFEQGGIGWNNTYAIQKEDDGNHYIINNYNWLIRQELNLFPNTTYKISAYTKKGTAKGPARMVLSFIDVNGNKLPQYYDMEYLHEGFDWEEIPPKLIVVPDKAAKTRIYLLSNDNKGFHCFDDIMITKTDNAGNQKNRKQVFEEQEGSK